MIGTLFRFLFIIADKLLNVILLGSPHKTVSMRLAFAMHCKFVRPRYSWVTKLGNWIDVLFHNRFYTLEARHIYKNYEAEEILSTNLWPWFVIINQAGYDSIIAKALKLRFEGREER